MRFYDNYNQNMWSRKNSHRAKVFSQIIPSCKVCFSCSLRHVFTLPRRNSLESTFLERSAREHTCVYIAAIECQNVFRWWAQLCRCPVRNCKVLVSHRVILTNSTILVIAYSRSSLFRPPVISHSEIIRRFPLVPSNIYGVQWEKLIFSPGTKPPIQHNSTSPLLSV